MSEPTATQILAMTDRDARTLFPGDAATIADRFRALARRWHPDRNDAPEAARVFAWIAALHDAAKLRLADAAGGETVFRTIEGRSSGCAGGRAARAISARC